MSGRADTRVFDILQERAVNMVERRARQQRKAIADAIQTDFGGVMAHVEGDAIVLEGRDLLERWLHDAQLRDVGRATLRSGRSMNR